MKLVGKKKKDTEEKKANEQEKENQTNEKEKEKTGIKKEQKKITIGSSYNSRIHASCSISRKYNRGDRFFFLFFSDTLA